MGAPVSSGNAQICIKSRFAVHVQADRFCAWLHDAIKFLVFGFCRTGGGDDLMPGIHVKSQVFADRKSVLGLIPLGNAVRSGPPLPGESGGLSQSLSFSTGKAAIG